MNRLMLMKLIPEALPLFTQSVNKGNVLAVCKMFQKIGVRPNRYILHGWFQLSDREEDRKDVWRLSQAVAELDATRFLRITVFRGVKFYDAVGA